MSSHKGTFIQIDLQNLYYAAKKKGVRVDFEKIWNFFNERQTEFITEALIYMIQSTDFDSSKFEAKLESIGYNLRIKKATSTTKTSRGRKLAIDYKQTNHDVPITLEAVDRMKTYDKLILMSGDGDFSDLCKYLKEKGKEIEIWCFKESCNQSAAYVNKMYFIEDSNFFYKKPQVNVFGFNWRSYIE